MHFYQDNDRRAIFKKLLVLFSVILAIFGIINGVWFFGYQRRYSSMADHLDLGYQSDISESEMLRYTKLVDGYRIILKMPEYLGEGGFVKIGKVEGSTVDVNDAGTIVGGNGTYVALYIWPQSFSGYQIGVDIDDPFNDISEQIEISSDMKVIHTEELETEVIEYLTQLIEERRDEIEKMMSIAEATLDISLRTD